MKTLFKPYWNTIDVIMFVLYGVTAFAGAYYLAATIIIVGAVISNIGERHYEADVERKST